MLNKVVFPIKIDSQAHMFYKIMEGVTVNSVAMDPEVLITIQSVLL